MTSKPKPKLSIRTVKQPPTTDALAWEQTSSHLETLVETSATESPNIHRDKPGPLAELDSSEDRTFPSKSVRWEDNNKRVTFYCPIDLAQQLENLPKDRSKSAFIVDAITAALSRDDASR